MVLNTPPAKYPSSDELIRDYLAPEEELPSLHQNAVYSMILDAFVTEGKAFDEICQRAVELGMPEAETIETFEAYQVLMDELYEGRAVKFQRTDGHYYLGTIDGEPTLRIDIDIPRSQTLAMLEIPIEYEGTVDQLVYYPRRSQESGDIILPGIKLL